MSDAGHIRQYEIEGDLRNPGMAPPTTITAPHLGGTVMDTIIFLIGACLLMSLVVMIDIWLNDVDS
jgi:hypothetical protein